MSSLRRMSVAGALLAGLLVLGACSLEAPAPTPGGATAAPAPTFGGPSAAPAPGSLIARVTTDKAMYAPGAPVAIAVELLNRSGAAYDGAVTVSFEHLGETVAGEQTRPAALGAGGSSTLTFTWAPPAADFQGYRVEAQARDSAGKTVLDSAATAVDVSSDWKRFPRYGFVSRFDAAVDPAGVMAKLNAYHINGVQFYDWQWQHHRPYSPGASWPDIANRQTARDTVAGLIGAAHRYNMVAMSYNLAYGAFDGYWQDGSGAKLEWGLFKDGGGSYTPDDQDYHPLPAGWATRKLYLMNPADAAWQQYIFGQERQVFDNFAFDGWHIDTLGKRGALWGWDRQMVNMPAAFVDFTNGAKAALKKRVVFNTVGGYGQDDIAARADVDVVYSELWEDDGVRTYADIVDLVARARSKTDKAVVLPAYMNRAYAQKTPGGATRLFREPSVRLADAAIFAAGATHLELGDGDGMLSTEYFPSQQLVMSDTLKAAMRDSYDFLVAYENLLLDGVSGSDSQVTIEGQPTSANGRRLTVWAMARSRPGYTIAHLINLKGNRLSFWRDDGAIYPAPEALSDLALKIYYKGSLRAGARLWYASPDSGHGKAHQLTYTTGTDAQGAFVACTVPRLEYWDMIWLEQ
ncbi:MAG: glycoside hydrolase family 66 protein [Kouleothrix sp.]|nr:glycoside hydrolase family 66 protein [Kouleothrix sp.]